MVEVEEEVDGNSGSFNVGHDLCHLVFLNFLIMLPASRGLRLVSLCNVLDGT